MNFYQTANFNFIAYLFTQDFKLDHTSKHPSREKITFIFEDPENKIPRLYTAFINGDLMVEVSAFVNAQKKVKSLIYG